MNKKVASKLKKAAKAQPRAAKLTPEPELVDKFVLPPSLPWIIKAAVIKCMQPLKDKITKVAEKSCQGAPLASVDKVVVSLKIIPVLQVSFKDQQGHASTINLEQSLVEDGNQDSYPDEANLYIETVRTVLTNLPDLKEWQQIEIDFAKTE